MNLKFNITLLSLFLSFNIFSDCVERGEYDAKLDFTFTKIYGSHDCVMDDAMKNDPMIAGYWVEERSKTLFIAINNFRAGKDIDLEFYGFNQRYLDDFLERIEDVSDVKFKKRYSYNGSPYPEVNKILKEEGFRR